MSPVLLAFDTSTESMALALQWSGGVLRWNGPGGALASAQLLPRIREWMQTTGLGWHEVDAIAFGRGPGAFTGLRTACAVAQGLAYGADKPVLPIDSLLIVAEDAHGPCRHGQVSARDARAASGDRAQSPGDPGTDCGGDSLFDIGIVMDARMGEVYAARYARTRHCSPPPSGACRLGDGAGAWRVVDPPVLCHPSELPLRWRERPARLAGNGLALTPWPHEPANRTEADRAAALLRLAEQAWQEGGAVPPAQALPLYLRDKVALTTVERAAARQSAAAVGP